MGLEFDGKVAVITGGGSGVGLATAKFLAQKGSSVAILERSGEKLNEAVNDIRALDTTRKIDGFLCDITSDNEVKTAFSKITSKFGRVDFLINNAGINTQKKIDELTEDDIRLDIDVKINGIIFCTREAVKIMNENGSIVNIASVTAYTGGVSSPSYYTGNAIANNLTKSLALQLAGKKIRVNAVAPGFIYPTGFTQNYTKEQIKKISDANPLKRVCSPDDVTKAIYFLLSDLSSYITGHTIHVNGGYYMN